MHNTLCILCAQTQTGENTQISTLGIFVSKALWNRTLKKKKLDCSLMKPSQNVPKHGLFKLCKFDEKYMVKFLQEFKKWFIMLKYWGHSALYEANLHRLTYKMPSLLNVKWKEADHFLFHGNFCMVFWEQLYTSYQICKSGTVDV